MTDTAVATNVTESPSETSTNEVAIRAIPKVKEPPLLGSLLGMATDPFRYFYRKYREYGSVYTMNVFGKKYTVLAGPESANFMSSREGKDALRSKEFWQGLIKEYGAHSSLPGSDGEQHAELKAILRHGYSRESIKGRYDELVDITDGSIERDWKNGESVSVVNAFQYMVTDQLGIMITGEAPLEYVEDIRITILYILNCLITRQRPKFLMLNPRYQRAKNKVFELGDQIKQDYLEGNRKVKERTLVDYIMEANAAGSPAMPDNSLRLHLTAPYVAGLDTVANTLGACVYTILKHPEVHQAVLKEVDEFFAEGEVEEAGLLKRLPVLNGAIMETMRLYPVGVALMRTANKDFIFDGCEIKEGTMLYMAICVPHLMEEYFPEPEKFDPYRYDKGRAEHRAPGAYSPYARGVHTCLGKSLAEIQLALSMARLFYRLDLSLPSPDYVMKTKTAPTPGPSMKFAVKVNGYRR